MNLSKAKELAAVLLKVGKGRIWINPEQNKKVEEAMTKDDIRALIAERIIKKRASTEQSRSRARVLAEKRTKGRRRGTGKRTGTKKTRLNKKSSWMGKVRVQRALLKQMRKENPEKFVEESYAKVYRKIKGNYFKGKKYLQAYIDGVKK
jgi:large subunit ribosomal protein L19e